MCLISVKILLAGQRNKFHVAESYRIIAELSAVCAAQFKCYPSKILRVKIDIQRLIFLRFLLLRKLLDLIFLPPQLTANLAALANSHFTSAENLIFLLGII